MDVFVFVLCCHWEREDEGVILLGIRGETLDRFLICVVGEEARYSNFVQAIPPHVTAPVDPAHILRHKKQTNRRRKSIQKEPICATFQSSWLRWRHDGMFAAMGYFPSDCLERLPPD